MLKTAAALCLLIASTSCHKKSADPAGSSSGSGSIGAAGSGSASSATTPPVTANGGEPTAVETITECPKSLAGTDKVNRVIKKECGTVVVTADYNIDGGTLTLEAGSTLAFDAGASLNIGYYTTAKLIVRGTKDAPVKFTAHGDKVPGFWKGIAIYEHGARSSIDGAVIELAGSDPQGSVRVDAVDVTLKSSTIKNSKQSAVTTSDVGSFAELSGNTFADIGVPASIAINPQASGSVAETNVFPPGGRINVTSGKIVKSITWKAKAPYAVLERVGIDGSDGSRAVLELAPGTTVLFDGDSGFDAGYYSEASLKAVGTKEAPITFTAVETKEPGGWDRIAIYDHAEAAFEYVMFEFGGADATKGVLAVEKATSISIKNCTFKNDKRGVVFASDEVSVKAFEGNTFDGTTDALALGPNVMGAVTSTTFGEGAKIEVGSGKIAVDTTWKAQTAEVDVKGTIEINKARLTVEAGSKLTFSEDAGFDVGYYDTAGLQLMGAAGKSIELRGARDEAGGWKGIHLYGHARANTIQHVIIHNAGDPAAVIADAGVELAVDDYVCTKCKAAALTYDCAAKVTATGVKADGGTPTGELKPTCK